MFGFEPSYSAKKALDLFKKNNITNIVELGAGLGRDTIFFAQNGIYVCPGEAAPLHPAGARGWGGSAPRRGPGTAGARRWRQHPETSPLVGDPRALRARACPRATS